MPRLTEKQQAAAVLDAKRYGYALCLEKTGPRPVDEAQLERFRETYRAIAADRIPE
jgi:hypothetical protein